jgi:hypothetical protein
MCVLDFIYSRGSDHFVTERLCYQEKDICSKIHTYQVTELVNNKNFIHNRCPLNIL